MNTSKVNDIKEISTLFPDTKKPLSKKDAISHGDFITAARLVYNGMTVSGIAEQGGVEYNRVNTILHKYSQGFHWINKQKRAGHSFDAIANHCLNVRKNWSKDASDLSLAQEAAVPTEKETDYQVLQKIRKLSRAALDASPPTFWQRLRGANPERDALRSINMLVA